MDELSFMGIFSAQMNYTAHCLSGSELHRETEAIAIHGFSVCVCCVCDTVCVCVTLCVFLSNIFDVCNNRFPIHEMK